MTTRYNQQNIWHKQDYSIKHYLAIGVSHEIYHYPIGTLSNEQGLLTHAIGSARTDGIGVLTI